MKLPITECMDWDVKSYSTQQYVYMTYWVSVKAQCKHLPRVVRGQKCIKLSLR